MIIQQCKMLLLNSRFLLGIFFTVLFGFLILYYQENREVIDGKGRAKCIEWAIEQEEPAQALRQRAAEIYMPDFEADGLMFADSQYYEFILCTDVAEYLDKVGNYDILISAVIAEQESIADFLGVSDFRIAVNRLSSQFYKNCRENPPKMGNYMSAEKFFSFDTVDVCLWLTVFLICYFTVVSEREKGLGQLVFPSANGGIRYFFTKLFAVWLMSAAAYIVFFAGKYGIYTSMYGSADMSVPVQSMSGYFGVPWSLNIGQYFAVFVIWKFAGVLLLAMLFIVLCSLPFTEALSGTLVFLVTGGSVLINYFLKGSSGLVLLRDCGIVQIISPEYWMRGFRAYRIFESGGKVWLIYGYTLPLICFGVYAAALVLGGVFIYYRGFRKSTLMNKSVSRALFNFGANRWWNEGYYLGIHKRLLLAAVGICAVYAAVICDYKPQNNENVKFERQVVGILNEKSFGEAREWLDAKEEEFAALEAETANKYIQMINGEISEEVYLAYCSMVNSQMRIRPVINKMQNQAVEMEQCMRDRGLTAHFEFTVLSGQMYGDEGWANRNWVGLLTAVFVVFCAMTVFPGEKNVGLHRLLGSMPGAVKGLRCRIVWLALISFILSVVLNVIWIYSLYRQFGLTGWNSPVQSWAVYRDIGLKINVGHAVTAEILWQGVKWMIIAGAGMFCSLFFSNTAWTELIGTAAFVLPPALHILGIDRFRIIPYIRCMIYGEQNLFDKIWGVILIFVFGAAVSAALRKGTQRWTEA